MSTPESDIEIIDLSVWNLPMDDEPFLPATGHYNQGHTRLWSEKFSEGDIFAFVFPQYSCGYPAALKNAIDHLYNEWKDKPALIVSYANRGSGKAAAQLKQVLDGIHMRACEQFIEIKLSEIEIGDSGEIIECDDSLEKYKIQIEKVVLELINLR